MVFNSDIRNGFKQFGQSLTTLKSITTDVIGQTELYANVVSSLTPKQQALALATKGLTETQIIGVMQQNNIADAEIKQALSSTVLIKKKKDLTEAIAKQALATIGLEEEDIKQILINANIVAGDKSQIISKNQVSKSILQTELATRKCTEAQIEGVMAEMGLGTSTLALSNYFKGLTTSIGASVKMIWTFLTTNPVGWCVAAAGAIAGVVAGINLYNKAINEGIEKANEAHEKTAESISDIEEYKAKITELKNALADETVSEEDAYNARKQLLGIQDELISKYGFQKESIDLVNDSLKEEIALLDEAARKESEKFLRENKKDINNAKKKVESTESFSKRFSSSKFNDLNDLVDQLYKNGFISINYQHDGSTFYDSDFKGTTDEAIEYYTKLYDYIDKYRQDNIGALSDTKNGLKNIDNILADVSDKINKINNEDYKNAKELYDSATASMLQTDANYRNIYKATVDAREEFQSAVANNDEDAISKSLESMAKAKEDFQSAFDNGKIVDNGVAEWFNNYYDAFKAESGKYQFKVDISANTNGLKDSVQEALNYFGDKTPTEFDVLNLEVEGSEEAQIAFQSLDSIATQYKTTIKELIPILEEFGVVQIDEKDIDITGGIISAVQSNLTEIKDQIDDIFKNTDLFDKAIESLNNGEVIDFDTVMSMISIDSSLADKFVPVADGYTIVKGAVDKLIESKQKYTEETRASIQSDIESSKQGIKIAEQNIKDLEAKRDAIKSAALFDHGTYTANDIKAIEEYNTAIQAEREHIKTLNNAVSENTLILNEMNVSVMKGTSCCEKSQNAISGMEAKITLLKTALTEMRDAGSISADTYAELAEKGEDYVNCLEIQNGKLVLNTQKLKDLDTAALKTAITTNELAMAQINASMSGHEWSEALKEEYQQIELATAALRDKLNEYNNTTPDDKSGSGSSSNEKPQSVLDYEKWVAEQEHKIAMGQLKEDEAYYDEKLRRAEEAYSGLADYESDLWKVQEEVYKGREKLAQEIFDKEHDLFEKRVDDLEDYADKLSETSVTSDGTNLTTQEKWQEVAAVYKEIQSEIEREINRIVQTGVEGNEDLLEELEKQWDEYADKISDTFKSAVEAEKSLLENQKSALSDVYDKEIDKIKKQQEDSKNAADAEIDLIQEKIDNLKKVNDEKQQEYDIEKAKQDLENKRQRTRMTYGSDGRIIYKQDDEAIAEAQQNLDKLLLEKQVNALETQKSLLEDMRDKESESYDKLIEDIESQKEQDERQFDILIQRLEDYLNPNSDTSNSDVWSEIAKMDGASYKNGKWVDKDGTEIDITALLSKADEIIDSNDKVADSNNKAEDNVKANTANKKSGNEDKTTTDKDNVKKNAPKTDEVQKEESKTEKVNNQLETAADIIGGIAGSADDFVKTILKTLGATSVKDLWTYSSNGIPNGNQVLSSQHDTSKWTANRDNYVTNNTNQPVNVSFGDINVNNPVGDAKKLAKEVKSEIFKEAMMQIPNDAMRIIYKN